MLIHYVHSNPIETIVTLFDIHILTDNKDEMSFIINDPYRGLYELIYDKDAQRCDTSIPIDVVPMSFKMRVQNANTC